MDSRRSWVRSLCGCVWLAAGATLFAGNPLWNGAGSVTNNYFSNTNNWVVGNVPTTNSIGGLPVGIGPLAAGATNTANCDATGNSQTWTFNAGTAPMAVTLNSQQLGAVTGPDVFINNSTNLQTVAGTFRLFDIGGPTTTRRFKAASGPLAITPATLTLRGDNSPTNWAIELSGNVAGSTLNCAFANGGNLGGKTVNLIKTGTGTWEITSPLPNLTTNPSSVTVSAGMLTLSATNSYTGQTIVSNGATLNTLAAATGAGAYAVSNVATLGVTRASAGSSLTNASFTLGTLATDATTLNLDLGDFGNPPKPAVTVVGALVLNGNCTVNVSGSGLSPGQFPLIKYGSLIAAGDFVLGALPPDVLVAALSNNAANSSLDLVVSPNPVFWAGAGSGLWDINTTANWQSNGVTGPTYLDGEAVFFDDTAAGNFAISLNPTVRPASVTVNGTNSYSLTGPGGIVSPGALNKNDSGVLVLGTTNTFGEPVWVNAGTLVLTNLNALAAGSVMNVAAGASAQPQLAGTYAKVTTSINGVSVVSGAFGGALNFRSGGTTAVTWPGRILLNAADATIGSYGVNNTVTLSGQLTGDGSLIIRPEGGSAASHKATFILTNPTNDYAGDTLMQVGTAQLSTTLKAGVNNALPVATTLNLMRAGSSGTVFYDLAGYSQTLSGLTSYFLSNAVISSSGTGTLTVSNNAECLFKGVIGTGGKAGINLVKQGGAALMLYGTNVYTGTTTIGSGALMLNGLITASSGLTLSNNATLQVSLGPPGGPTNLIVNGNVTLAGDINLNDAGIVSNAVYPVIYYSGTLTTNGLRVAPLPPWAFTIDTSVPHLVRLIPTQQYPPVEFTNGNFAVTTLTTNLGGILRGTPAEPIWYEVRDQTNKLWDFGARAAASAWSITVRHLREGTNTVTIFARDGGGNIQSNSVRLTLNLGKAPPVRPRPIPAEIWWGGISDNTGLTNYSQWPFVQQHQDGYFFHSAYWSNSLGWLEQSLAQNLQPFNTKFCPELGGNIPSPGTNSGHTQGSAACGKLAVYQANGLIMSELTHDYHMVNMQPVCQVNPTWPTNDQIAFWTGDLSVASTNYPYTTGIWRAAFNDYYAQFPHVKVGHTSQPEYWPWDNNPVESPLPNQLSFTVTNELGQNIAFSFNAHDIVGSFINMATAIGQPYFSLQSDAPWDYFGGLRVGTAATEARMRLKIRVYEQYLQSRACRHTLICNVSNAAQQPGGNDAQDSYYEQSSLNNLYLHQQEGGRANRYLFESWYWGIPHAVVPETKAGSYTHLAASAIKYLKGIRDTNGALETLSLTLTRSGVTNIIQLTNGGDVTCLPAVIAMEGAGGGNNITYYNASDQNITAAIRSPEGYVHTNNLAPGQTTQITIVATNKLDRAITLEVFWNPQDPTGIVRDRLILTPSNQAPALNLISNRTLIAGQTLAFTNVASDSDLPPQTLTFSLLAPPSGATVNAGNGGFSWRPAIAQSPSTNFISVKVTDSGTPNLSATQNFLVIVIKPARPTVSALGFSNGQLRVTIAGDSGPDCAVYVSTNLTAWTSIWTTNSPVPPFVFFDSEMTNLNRRFYRVYLGP